MQMGMCSVRNKQQTYTYMQAMREKKENKLQTYMQVDYAKTP